MATVAWSDHALQRMREQARYCYIVTVRRCSMLLDDTAIKEFDSVE